MSIGGHFTTMKQTCSEFTEDGMKDGRNGTALMVHGGPAIGAGSIQLAGLLLSQLILFDGFSAVAFLVDLPCCELKPQAALALATQAVPGHPAPRGRLPDSSLSLHPSAFLGHASAFKSEQFPRSARIS